MLIVNSPYFFRVAILSAWQRDFYETCAVAVPIPLEYRVLFMMRMQNKIMQATMS